MKKIFYLHIPKTGGQTLASRLSSAFPYGKSSIMSENLVFPEGIDRLKSILNEKDFVEGHVSGAVLSSTIFFDIIVTVRNPIEQISSNYLHILREPASPLHSAARKLSCSDFFDRFGDFFCNFQSRYLASAFFNENFSHKSLENVSFYMMSSLDQVRWLVPTDSIDDFVAIWELENQVIVPRRRESVNIAINKEMINEIQEIIRDRPHFYSIDLLLWSISTKRYRDYRDRVLRNHIDVFSSNNQSRVFWENEEGIWLLSGWYAAQKTESNRTEWWAGPESVSEVVYKKRKGARFLSFKVTTVCGIRRSDVVARGGQNLIELKYILNNLSDNEAEVIIDISSMPDEGSIFLCVPEVWSPVMLDSKSEDFSRRSFSSSHWRIIHDIVADNEFQITPESENKNSGNIVLDLYCDERRINMANEIKNKNSQNTILAKKSINYIEGGPGCKICGSDTHFKFSIPSSKMSGGPIPNLPDDCPYFECNSCLFLFCDRHDHSDHTRLYDPHYWEDQDPDWGGRVNQTLRLVMMANQLLKMPPWELKILDFGCGMGTFVDSARNQVQLQVWGTDIIKPKFGLEWFMTDLPKGFFDVIVSCEVIEHLPDPVGIIKNTIKSLRPGGVFAFQTARYDPKECGRDWWYIGPGNGHISLYSDKAFDRLSKILGVKDMIIWNGYTGLQAWRL